MELQKLREDSLEYMGKGAKSFITELFQALENGTASKINSEGQSLQPSQQPFLADDFRSLTHFSPKQDNLLTSFEQSYDFEDQYFSDDIDDDDQNSKYCRREEAEPNTMQNDTDNQFVRPNSQTSWGGFGFTSVMANSSIDPLNPLRMQRAPRPNTNPPLNTAQPRQRCSDFDEQGFCLRGDMCPLEHGFNCIVVEDVQSLSWFNLPDTDSSSHAAGVHYSSGALSPSSNLLASSKPTPIENIKFGTMDVSSSLNNIPSTFICKDTDVYDPDQPLWNNQDPTNSTTLLIHSSPNIEDKSSYDVIAAPLDTQSSIRGQIGSGNKPGSVKMEEHKEDFRNPHVINQNNNVSKIGIGPKSNLNYVNKSGKSSCPKALHTLRVNGIPRKRKKRHALVTHFQNFGEVTDVYFPPKSDQGFVQFLEKEAAEAALNSPDAIMSNCFLKLSWANQDRFLDDGPSSSENKFIQPFVSKLNTANGENGTVPTSCWKSNIAASNTAFPVSAPAINLMNKSHKGPAPEQKKMEIWELLRELRKKRESLDKKHNDFRRQLEEFEKQFVLNKKGDVISEQAAKRQKVDASSASINAAYQVAKKKPEKNREVLASGGSKTNPLTVRKPLRNIYQTSSVPVPWPNRYKLDNRSTTFKILPPLPVGFANATALKDHFSCYGIITSTVVEDPDHIDSTNPTSCKNISACITFANRQSAENAFVKGTRWGGHNLTFKWLIATQKILSNRSLHETSSNLPTSTYENAEAQKTFSQYHLSELMWKSPINTHTHAYGKDVATASQKGNNKPNRKKAARKRKKRLGRNLHEEESTTIDSQEAAAEAMKMSFGKGSYARKLLEKMGWKDGEALGSSRKGILEPLQAVSNKGNAGLGWKTTPRGSHQVKRGH